MLLFNKWWVKMLAILLIVGLLIIIQFEYFASNDLRSPTEICSWKDGDPQLFHLKTTSGVNYDGGHWFHVAENFMVQHSILRNSGNAADADQVFFNTDRAHFDSEMNGVTRFMLALGMTSGESSYWHIGTTNIDFPNMKSGSSVVLDINDFVQPPALYSSLDPESTRFIEKHDEKTYKRNKKVCVKYLGSVGGEWPTPQRGHWFPKTGDVETFRKKIETLCPFKENKYALSKKTKKFKLVVYQRDLSRVVVNLDDTLGKIKATLPRAQEWDIQVLMHSQTRTPCMLAAELYNADVLVTAHGFQSMLLLFLPQPSLLFEIYPYRYFKPAYGPLSREYGIQHACVMSPPQSWMNGFLLKGVSTATCMLTKTCREFARGDDVALTDRGIMKLNEAISKLLNSSTISGSTVGSSAGTLNMIYQL